MGDAGQRGNGSAAGGQDGTGGLLEAWGGRAVACARAGPDEACAASMADGSAGRAAVCMRFSAGAVGGAVPADGLFCGCADFRSGADCGSVESGAVLAAAAFFLLVGLSAWTHRYAQMTLREIVLAGKQGDGGPVRIAWAAQLSCVCHAWTELIFALTYVSPLPYYSLRLAYDIVNTGTALCLLAMSAYTGIMFRQVLNLAEGKNSSSVRDTYLAHGYVVIASLCILATSRSPLRQVAFIFFALLLFMPAIALAFRVRRLIEEANAKLGGTGDDSVSAALARINHALRHMAVFIACYLMLRLLVRQYADLVQTPELRNYLLLCIRISVFLNSHHLVIAVVHYVGGPARQGKKPAAVIKVTNASEPQIFAPSALQSPLSSRITVVPQPTCRANVEPSSPGPKP
jgi:hypothetical protein